MCIRDRYRTAPAHYGGKIAFLSDGTLIITSGDGYNNKEDAQFLDNHFGKIIRINPDGSVPSDNPFVDQDNALPEIYSYGHRNMQGLVISNDVIYENEHGPKGGDEFNIVEPEKIMEGQQFVIALTTAELKLHLSQKWKEWNNL